MNNSDSNNLSVPQQSDLSERARLYRRKKKNEHPIARAAGAGYLAQLAMLPVGGATIGTMFNTSGGDEQLAMQHLKEMLRAGKLDKTGLKVVPSYSNEVLSSAGKSKSKLLNLFLKLHSNAQFDHTNNSITTTGKGKLTPAILAHELGHAQIEHQGKLSKLLQRGRGLTAAAAPLSSLIATQGLVTDKDSMLEGAGKGSLIGLLAHSPTITNEIDASRRGLGLLLRSSLSPKHKILSSLALLPGLASYGASAALPSGVFGLLSARAKNKVREHNEKLKNSLNLNKESSDMQWARQSGGVPQMAQGFDFIKNKVIPAMQQGAYNFGGKAYDTVANFLQPKQPAAPGAVANAFKPNWARPQQKNIGIGVPTKTFSNLSAKTGGDRPGLWENIRAKRARGEKPAKPGEKGYPDKKQWKRLTSKTAEMNSNISPSIKLSALILDKLAGSPAWQRSEGKNPEGGLNAKGRASYNRQTGGNLKAPVTESKPSGERAKRRSSFCARMCGHKRKNTGSATKNDPESRVNKALRKWRCKCGEELLKKAVLNMIFSELEKSAGMPRRPGLPSSRAFSKPTQIKPQHDMTGNPTVTKTVQPNKTPGFTSSVYASQKATMGNMLQHMRAASPNGKLGLGNPELGRLLRETPRMYSSLLGGDMKRLAGQMNSFGAGYDTKNFE